MSSTHWWRSHTNLLALRTLCDFILNMNTIASSKHEMLPHAHYCLFNEWINWLLLIVITIARTAFNLRSKQTYPRNALCTFKKQNHWLEVQLVNTRWCLNTRKSAGFSCRWLVFIRTIQDAPVCDTSWSGFVQCIAPALFHVPEPVRLFSNIIFFGYFNPENKFLGKEIK